jgi:integrase
MPSVWIRPRATASGDKRFQVEYRLGGRGTRIRYGGIFKTKRDAETRRKWISGELAALRAPDLTILTESPLSPTLADAAERWQASRVDVAENTRLQHRTALRKALPVLGTKRIDTLTTKQIADLVAQLHSEGAKRESIRKVVNSIAMVLDYAGVTPNPARDKINVRLPREEAEEINPPSASDLVAIYQLLPSKHRLALLFLDWSGTRVGAIDSVLVGDYDESRRRIRLRKATTKTRQGLWIDLHPALADAIEAQLPPREDRDLDARLFAESGSDALRTAMAKACRALGMPIVSPHDLRHRRISLLHLRGVPWARIGEQVGQRNLAVTANVYTHVLADETELDYDAMLSERFDVSDVLG